jgi:hypothetical protein
MQWLLDLLDNKSVAAFMGAFSAFLLVIVNDGRRERKKVQILKSEIELNQVVARNKLDTARGNRSLIRNSNRITAAPTLKFNTELIRDLGAEVLGRLTSDQRRALEALCYRMEAIDGLFCEATEKAKKFEPPSSLTNEQRHNIGRAILDTYEDIIVNLKILIENCGEYVNGHFTEIVTRQYDRANYEEN